MWLKILKSKYGEGKGAGRWAGRYFLAPNLWKSGFDCFVFGKVAWIPYKRDSKYPTFNQLPW